MPAKKTTVKTPKQSKPAAKKSAKKIMTTKASDSPIVALSASVDALRNQEASVMAQFEKSAAAHNTVLKKAQVSAKAASAKTKAAKGKLKSAKAAAKAKPTAANTKRLDKAQSDVGSALATASERTAVIAEMKADSALLSELATTLTLRQKALAKAEKDALKKIKAKAKPAKAKKKSKVKKAAKASEE